jgi:hypothetical protein
VRVCAVGVQVSGEEKEEAEGGMMAPRQFPGVSLAEAKEFAAARGWTEAIAKNARVEAAAFPTENGAEGYRFGFIYWLLVFLQEDEDRTEEEQAFCEQAEYGSDDDEDE